MPTDDRSRRRIRSTRKRGGPNVLVIAAVLGCVLVVVIAGGVVAFVLVSKLRPTNPVAEAPRPAAPTNRTTSPTGSAVPPATTAPAAPEVVPPPKLPSGWAYNNPVLGFRAAWPVAPGADGFAAVSLLGNVGGGGSGKSYGHVADGIVFTVSWSDLSFIPGAEEIEPLALVDRYIARAKQIAAARGAPVDAVQSQPTTVAGVPGREVRAKGTVTRYVAIHGKVWMLGVRSETNEVNPADPKLAPFFESFTALK